MSLHPGRVVKVLITGAAGFIGAALADKLTARGDEVLGVDNLSDYYDVRLKQARLARLERRAGFRFTRLDITDRAAMRALFEAQAFDVVVHLAAQADAQLARQVALADPGIFFQLFQYLGAVLVGQHGGP